MWSLEIRTQRIFNNLIKQNQKLASDFVLKQSINAQIMPSVQSVASNVQGPESSVQHLRPEFRRSGMPRQSLLLISLNQAFIAMPKQLIMMS